MKIGVIFNPGAGGLNRYFDIGKKIENLFAEHELCPGSSVFGAKYIAGIEIGFFNPEKDFNQNLDNILSEFITTGIKILVCVGGDGFLTHTAGFLISKNICIPLMGLAGGTANIGPLIKFNEINLNSFSLEAMILEKIGCIEVSSEENLLGYAFCDVIFGDSFLGTLENRMCNLSTKSFLETGSKIEIAPGEHIIGDRFSLLINNKKKKIKSKKIAQIIISPLFYKDFYRGKAIAGALCFSSYDDSGAAIGISDSIVVSKEFPDTDSILMEQFLFGKNDIVKFDGIKEDISVIIDGNVYEISGQSVTLRFIEEGAQSVVPERYKGLPV